MYVCIYIEWNFEYRRNAITERNTKWWCEKILIRTFNLTECKKCETHRINERKQTKVLLCFRNEQWWVSNKFGLLWVWWWNVMKYTCKFLFTIHRKEYLSLVWNPSNLILKATWNNVYYSILTQNNFNIHKHIPNFACHFCCCCLFSWMPMS